VRHRAASVLLLGALAAGTPPAAAEIAFKLPPPAIVGLMPLAALPLDKPQVAQPPVTVPPPPLTLPQLPTPRLVSDVSHRPVAAMRSARMLACNPVGTLLGVASELLECGRARYQRGELESARQALQGAAQGEGDVGREARYWLGETLLRLGRTPDAERAFQLVWREDARGELGAFATVALGFIALEVADAARALGYFDSLLKAPVPIPLIPYLRHGRALALYGLGRHAEARDQWSALLAASPPAALANEVAFWYGDTLGRLGDYPGAVLRLQQVAARGAPPLAEPALLSLGWWSHAAGEPREAATAFRTLLTTYPRATVQAAWARAGLVLALLDLDDQAAAAEEAKRLEELDRTGALAQAVNLQMRRWAAEKARDDLARALDADLLARNLDPATRAWVLVMSAELARKSGSPGEARDQLALLRSAAAPEPLKQHAGLRLAQLEFEARNFAAAQAAAESLLGQSLGADARAAARVLAGVAAYWARD
jgi:TolA-binding protein